MKVHSGWLPAAILGFGLILLSGGVREQVSMPLVAPLDTSVPTEVLGYTATDVEISEEEQRVAGMTNFVLRLYSPPGEVDGSMAEAFSIYVGYYDRQSQGKTIHSPRNCLPGGGWEPLTSSRERIPTPTGQIPVNRYLIGNGQAQALVLYWYQGRGRTEANEYLVKWHLLQDQALHGRSDEALVRVIVPVTTTEEDAYAKAVSVAGQLVQSVDRAIPS
ncbi:MAG: EpsI family protein [Gemmatimonadetes bacterium]|nr:EpsI family protein [Gemmatimonadota bacterium]